MSESLVGSPICGCVTVDDGRPCLEEDVCTVEVGQLGDVEYDRVSGDGITGVGVGIDGVTQILSGRTFTWCCSSMLMLTNPH